MAMANGTVSEAKPMNSTGGWMVIHGSWSSGFRPCPSGGTRPGGNSRNGPRITLTSPSMMSGRFRKAIAVSVSGCRSRISTRPSVAVSSAQSRNVPSCPPQKAAKMKCAGIANEE